MPVAGAGSAERIYSVAQLSEALQAGVMGLKDQLQVQQCVLATAVGLSSSQHAQLACTCSVMCHTGAEHTGRLCHVLARRVCRTRRPGCTGEARRAAPCRPRAAEQAACNIQHEAAGAKLTAGQQTTGWERAGYIRSGSRLCALLTVACHHTDGSCMLVHG